MKLDVDKLKEDLLQLPLTILTGVFMIAAFGWLLLGFGWIGVAMLWSDYGKDVGIIALIINSVIFLFVAVISFFVRYSE